MCPIASFKVNGRDINLFGCRYSVGPVHQFVLATDDGEPFGTVTVNVPGYPLADDEVPVKTCEENAPARQPLLNSGVFMDTGKRVPCGDAEAEVWKLLPTKLM